jgi:hypothetical protein
VGRLSVMSGWLIPGQRCRMQVALGGLNCSHGSPILMTAIDHPLERAVRI